MALKRSYDFDPVLSPQQQPCQKRRRYMTLKSSPSATTIEPSKCLDVTPKMTSDTEIRLEESTISDQKDDKCWFTENFLDPELCLLKEEICQKLESFPWLSGAYGITGPNKKIQHPHLYVTVKRGIPKSKK